MSIRTVNRTIWFIITISLCWGIVIALDLAPVLRGDYGWRWPYKVPQHPERLLPIALILLVGIIGGVRTILLQKARWILLWSMLFGIMLSLSAIYVTETDVQFELYTRTISGGTTGWHYASTDIEDVDETLSDWPNFMHQYVGQSSHMTTSPPGFPLIFYVGAQLFSVNDDLANDIGRPLRADQCHNDRVVGWSLYPGYSNPELASAWIGMLMPLWGVLVVIPLYWLGRALYNEKVGRWSSLWWALVPSFLMFTPNPTPIYALIGLTVISMLLKGMDTQRSYWVLSAGIVMSIGTFLHFSTLPIIFLAGLFVLGYQAIHCENNKSMWYQSVQIGIGFGLGLVSIWGIYLVVYGVGVWDVFNQSLNEHLSLDRPYLPWLFLHLNDFFMFTGWTFSILAGFGIWNGIKQYQKDRKLNPSIILSFSVVITLVVMDISGTTQGESGRIWLFLSPFLLLTASDYLVKIGDNNIQRQIIATICQGILLLIMVGFLHVIGSGLSKPPSPPSPIVETSSNVIPSGARFGDVLQLKSFSGYVEMEGDEATLHLWLNWASNGQLETPYYLLFIPVKPDGQTLQANLRQPFDNNYPITCWLPESGSIQDYVEIPLRVDDATGDWWVSLSLISRDAETLDVKDVNGVNDQQTGVGPFRIE